MKKYACLFIIGTYAILITTRMGAGAATSDWKSGCRSVDNWGKRWVLL